MRIIIFKLSLALFILFTVSSCNDSIPDSNIIKTYSISDFSKLNVEIIGDVYYEQSDSFYLNVSGSASLIKELKVNDKEGVLLIELGSKRNRTFNKKQLIIKVGSPKLESINFNSIGTLHIKNQFKNDKLSIINNGVGEIIIENCNVNTFDLNTKSVGSVDVDGTANEVFINSDGIGEIDFSKFKSKNTKVVSKGIGNISVYAQNRLDITVKGIGNVKYYGNPADVKSDISGLGKITNVDK